MLRLIESNGPTSGEKRKAIDRQKSGEIDANQLWITCRKHMNDIGRPKCQVNVKWRQQHNGIETVKRYAYSRSCAPSVVRIDTIGLHFRRSIYYSLMPTCIFYENYCSVSTEHSVAVAFLGNVVRNRASGCWHQAFAIVLRFFRLFQVAKKLVVPFLT